MKTITNCVVKTSTLVDLSFKFGLSEEKYDGRYTGLFSVLAAVKETVFSFDKETGAFYITNSAMDGYDFPEKDSQAAGFAMAVYNLREEELDSTQMTEEAMRNFASLQHAHFCNLGQQIFEGNLEALDEIFGCSHRQLRPNTSFENKTGCFFVLDLDYLRVITNIGVIYSMKPTDVDTIIKICEATRSKFGIVIGRRALLRTLPGQGPIYLEVEAADNWLPCQQFGHRAINMVPPFAPGGYNQMEIPVFAGYNQQFAPQYYGPVPLQQTYNMAPEVSYYGQNHMVQMQPGGLTSHAADIGRGFKPHAVSQMLKAFNGLENQDTVIKAEHLGPVMRFPEVRHSRNTPDYHSDADHWTIIPLINLGNLAYQAAEKQIPFAHFEPKAKSLLAKLRTEGELLTITEVKRTHASALYRDKVVNIVFDMGSDDFQVVSTGVFEPQADDAESIDKDACAAASL